MLEKLQPEIPQDLVEVKEPITFEEIAKQIIKKSIRSAICIDDRFIEPYMETEQIEKFNQKIIGSGESLDFETPCELYKSFRKDGECDLDIYHFNNMEDSWHPEYMLNNKDLVVLDWELEGTGKFESTLLILTKILEDDKIPFVIIYTQKPQEEFFEIAKNLIANFNLNTQANQQIIRDRFYSEFCEHLIKISSDEVWDDDKAEIFWERTNISKILLEYILTPSKRADSKNTLQDEIIKEFNITGDLEKKMKTVMKNIFNSTYPLSIELLGYLFVNVKNEIPYVIQRIDVDEAGFRINNCIVTLFSKPNEEGTGVNPENVFNQFSNLISKSPHNFLTLLSLEMRDRFREDFSKIGNDISQIDERAFFSHLQYYKTRSEANYENHFYDFLLKSWTNELTEYNINLKPEIFNAIEDYQTKNNLKEIKGTDIINPLADLAVKLSTTTIKDRLERDKKIRFGDIFKMITYNDEGNILNTNEYVLSITPHCVCLDSCKIGNNFYFILSEDVSENYSSALKKVEVEHYSFVNDNKVKAIKWGECKPFTMYIKNNELQLLTSNYMGNNIKLEYITTLQDNFAQRISNKSFSYGTSIGIDLPHLS